MTTEQMQAFCSPPGESTRYFMQTPFVIDGWRYATDRIICIRVKADEPNTTHDIKPPPADTLFVKFDAAKCVMPWPTAEYTQRMQQDTCPECGDPDGDPYEVDDYTVIGTRHVAAEYDKLIRTLGDSVRYAEGRKNEIISFVWDEGQGVVMPLRQE